jgi:hypothetical protein
MVAKEKGKDKRKGNAHADARSEGGQREGDPLIRPSSP